MVTTSDSALSALMARAQAGDSAAYRAVLNHCQTWLARYYRSRIAPDEVDDLVQETLLALHRKRATYDPQRAFLPWLAAIARYRWIDRLRRHYRAAEVALPETVAVGSHEAEVTARVGIAGLLSRLPDGQALAIRLTRIEGLNTEEAAQRAGQSESLIKTNVHRGLKRLAAMIESE